MIRVYDDKTGNPQVDNAARNINRRVTRNVRRHLQFGVGLPRKAKKQHARSGVRNIQILLAGFSEYLGRRYER